MESEVSPILSIIALGIIISVYMLPGIVAIARKHHNASAIFLATLLLGWTGIVWIVTLIWAFTNPAHRG